jgi:excinuclease ABC subunit B
VKRGIQETLKLYSEGEDVEKSLVADSGEDIDTLAVISELEEEMQEAASKLEFERAALIRDQINKLKKNSGDRPLPVKKKR